MRDAARPDNERTRGSVQQHGPQNQDNDMNNLVQLLERTYPGANLRSTLLTQASTVWHYTHPSLEKPIVFELERTPVTTHDGRRIFVFYYINEDSGTAIQVHLALQTRRLQFDVRAVDALEPGESPRHYTVDDSGLWRLPVLMVQSQIANFLLTEERAEPAAA